MPNDTGRKREGDRDFHTGAEEESRHWSAGRVLVRLPAELHAVAEALSRILVDETHGSELEWPEDLEADSLPILAMAFRDAIEEARESGASRSVVNRLHANVDDQLTGLAVRLVQQTREESILLLRDVSHDLRSPLNSILFLADTLHNEHSGALNEVQQRQIGVLYTAAVTLVGLVNDLIDAARIGDENELVIAHGAFSLEPVLNDIESLIGPLAQYRSVALRFRLETVGRREGDRKLLARVLINLVTNAIQASDPGGTVEIGVAEAEDGGLAIRVSDQGRGEEVAQLRALLDADGSDAYPRRRPGGWTHGLGLTICARLVRAAAGRIDVESLPGEGTTFHVALPFYRD